MLILTRQRVPTHDPYTYVPQFCRTPVLPPGVMTRLAVEAAASFGWCRHVTDDGGTIAIDGFGASAPAKENFKHYGFTGENVMNRARGLVHEQLY